ncbi:PREDICTED: uncharacterized protein LOC108760715 [Trachymyrmex cornetzi]|uniref:uncharacterized protein LOC108760715 n=1 Tax=Trachymyrmex cornetzi TaxID=471704 RepID=UPI00084F4C30|nr:PREDICTED: uncharacterized protein LOC108760715 [Trachymyrmex cornetzi]
MKRSLTFLILALIATVIADDNNQILEKIAKVYQTDVSTFQECLDEEEIKIEEVITWFQNWHNRSSVEQKDSNEESRPCRMKYKKLVTCILQKKQLLVDGKLVIDKIIERAKEDINKNGLPEISEEALTNIKECLNSLNENDQLTKEDRAVGATPCIITNYFKGEKQ